MADWVRACACDDIEDEDLIRWDHAGRTYAIYKAEDGFYCTDGMCTHEEEHFEEGLLTGHVIECPLHQGRFDIQDGGGDFPSALRRSQHLSREGGRRPSLREGLGAI